MKSSNGATQFRILPEYSSELILSPFSTGGGTLGASDLADTGRHGDEDVIVFATGFENGDPMVARFRQSRRQHTTGAARADDDIVELIHSPVAPL